MLGDFLLEILCGGLFWFLIWGGKGTTGVSESLADTPSAQSLYQDFLEKYEPNDNEAARRLRKSLTPAQRRLQQMQNCSIDSCNALTYRASNYCLRHQPRTLEEIVSEPEPEPDPQAEANWWEEEN